MSLLYNNSLEKVLPLVEQLALSDQGHKISSLSKSYRQRVSLARVLLHEPAF
ncbi:hypothetical protein [Bacteroidetes bacterium endosymbiont of Geopemphigus sp.]|uniref:hypothetical protein n=1 Tax=Bacteroidetes bacterium endosymbiont of Geopemphigus sp. TaxID=2047937 RepID=UPI0018A87FC5|nr:hypothetical protein [Bacteroidetes bacterium endosymbiont of Geopemphigus sp.]